MIDNPFRPNSEAISAIILMLACIAMLMLPLPWLLKLPCVTPIALLCAWRSAQAYENYFFKKNLQRLPSYALKPDEIPCSNLALFMGMGFKWTQKHTQRLMMARLPENVHLLERSALYKYLRNLEIESNGKSKIAKIAKKLQICPPLPPVGGSPEIHGVEPNEEMVWSDIGERVGHMLVLGTTRVGKTRFAEMIITQDIRRGDVTIVFDPKGDEELLKRMFCEAQKAKRKFYVFHLGQPKFSCRYNPIGSYSRVTEVATRIANQLPSEGQSAAFRDFVWRYVNVMTKIMEYLGITPTYASIYATASNIDALARQYLEKRLDAHDPLWRVQIAQTPDFKFDEKQAAQALKGGRDPEVIRISNFFKHKGINDPVADSIATILSNDRSYFEKLVSSLYPLLEKLTTGLVAELISPEASNFNDDRPILDWANIIQNEAVVYVGLDSLTDAEVAAAVGNAMFADLTSNAGQIYKHGNSIGQKINDPSKKIKVCVHADEFNELIGDEFIPMLNKAGGAGYQVTVYTQTWSDVEAKIGSSAKAAQIGGNLNSLVMLRVKQPETAEILTNQIPLTTVYSMTAVSGASDISNPVDFTDFSSKNEDRIAAEKVPMLEPADLVKLPKGQAFALLEGGQLWKLRLPLAKQDDESALPKNISAIYDYILDVRTKKVDYDESDNTLTVNGSTYG